MKKKFKNTNELLQDNIRFFKIMNSNINTIRIKKFSEGTLLTYWKVTKTTCYDTIKITKLM